MLAQIVFYSKTGATTAIGASTDNGRLLQTAISSRKRELASDAGKAAVTYHKALQAKSNYAKSAELPTFGARPKMVQSESPG